MLLHRNIRECPSGGNANLRPPFRGARDMVEVREDDLSGEKTRNLLALHLAGMHASSPPGNVFALDLSGLLVPEVTVWTAWLGYLWSPASGPLRCCRTVTAK